MAVIKRAKADRIADGAIVLDLADLHRQGERLIAVAEERAATVRAEAEAEAERLVGAADGRGFEQGRERGLAEGRAEGEEAGRADAIKEHGERLATLLDGFTAALDRWESDREAMLLAAREEVLDFALALARKIVLRIPEIDASVVIDQLSESLAQMLRPSAVTVGVHPDDLPLVAEVLPTLCERFDTSTHARVEGDETITPGGCVVRTEHGSIDATLDTQLDRITRALLPGRASDETGDETGES